MMTIDTYIQQYNEEFLRLEIAYSNLYQAYVSGNREDMIAKYIAVGNVNIPYLTDSIYLNTKQTMLDNGVIPNVLPTSIYDIKDDTLLRMNIQGCLKALQFELGRRNIILPNIHMLKAFYIDQLILFSRKRCYIRTPKVTS